MIASLGRASLSLNACVRQTRGLLDNLSVLAGQGASLTVYGCVVVVEGSVGVVGRRTDERGDMSLSNTRIPLALCPALLRPYFPFSSISYQRSFTNNAPDRSHCDTVTDDASHCVSQSAL